jgi:hypothetical protein
MSLWRYIITLILWVWPAVHGSDPDLIQNNKLTKCPTIFFYQFQCQLDLQALNISKLSEFKSWTRTALFRFAGAPSVARIRLRRFVDWPDGSARLISDGRSFEGPSWIWRESNRLKKFHYVDYKVYITFNFVKKNWLSKTTDFSVKKKIARMKRQKQSFFQSLFEYLYCLDRK